MQKIVLSNETLATLISNINILSTSENKVRFSIGEEDTGNGLKCWASIVSGGVMLKSGFMSMPPKPAVKLEEGKPYMSFIVKAKDFCVNAGVLLPYKADVTLSDAEGKIFFSCSGTKIPVCKVDPSYAEPLLEEDYDKKLVTFRGEQVMGTFEKGGCAASFGGNCEGIITKLNNGNMYVCSTSGTALAYFHCPVAVEGPAVSADPANNQDSKEAAAYLLRYTKNLPEEQQEEMKQKVAPIINDPNALKELAQSLGWKENETSDPAQGAPVGPVSFTLSPANWKLLTKLFAGSKKCIFLVTPKNLHAVRQGIKATFALNDPLDRIARIIERVTGIEKPIKIEIDKEKLLGVMKAMQLGDPTKPFFMKANAKGLIFSKPSDEITSCIGILASKGNLADVGAYYSASLFSSVASYMKAGNVVISYIGKKDPLFISNGTIEEDGPGFTALLAVNSAAAQPSEEADEED